MSVGSCNLAVTVLFLLSIVPPILLVAGFRRRAAWQDVIAGLGVVLIVLMAIFPELSRLASSREAVDYWAMCCGPLFVQSLVLSLIGIKRGTKR